MISFHFEGVHYKMRREYMTENQKEYKRNLKTWMRVVLLGLRFLIIRLVQFLIGLNEAQVYLGHEMADLLLTFCEFEPIHIHTGISKFVLILL